jgi:thioester reductase-like protein
MSLSSLKNMPTTKNPFYKVDPSLGHVLVTGATGYVAGVLIQQLLEVAVTIPATVRDASRTEKYQYIQAAADKTPGSIKFFSADSL